MVLILHCYIIQVNEADSNEHICGAVSDSYNDLHDGNHHVDRGLRMYNYNVSQL
jgi:hypothetical protein